MAYQNIKTTTNNKSKKDKLYTLRKNNKISVLTMLYNIILSKYSINNNKRGKKLCKYQVKYDKQGKTTSKISKEVKINLFTLQKQF